MLICRLLIFLSSVFVVALGHADDRPADAQSAGTQQISDRKTSVADSNAPTCYWPSEVEFDASVPSPKSVLGFEIGQRHLAHAELVRYLDGLAQQSDRVSVERIGHTHGGRPQLILTITNQRNRKRLESIRAAHQALCDPERAGDVKISDVPAVIVMGYGVHGDEPSATNVAPLVAHYLAAARGETIDRILDQCVILLDPCLNPDGFDRFAAWVNRFRGNVPSPDPNDVEHQQGWPRGRVNYYWFDLNRDWLPAVHPESQNRLRVFHHWKPNVVLDFHEMGTRSTYFFQPGVPTRTNPYTPKKNIELTRAFADYHAKALDKRGSLFFTEERYDDFYMGKGSTYPDLHGAVGILFEQASSRGHVQQNQDGLLTFHETFANHFATSLSSLRATTDMREQLLDFQRNFYRDSLSDAKRQPIKTLVYSLPGNRSRLQDFADVLLRHDIRCAWLNKDLPYGDDVLPEGSLAVPIEQHEYSFLKSLRMRDTSFEENIFYDVSTWCLPLAFSVKESEIRQTIAPEDLEPARIGDVRPSTFAPSEQDIAYLVDWTDDAAMKLLVRLQNAGYRVRVALEAFTTGSDDRQFPAGTLQVHLGTQEESAEGLRDLLGEAAKEGVNIYPVKSALTPIGADLGSSDFPVLVRGKTAMLVGPGVSQYEAGEIWHLLDHQLAFPVTKLSTSRFPVRSLPEYQTILIPSGDDDLSENDFAGLKEWAEDGGTVILTGRSARSRLDAFTRRESDSPMASVSAANQNDSEESASTTTVRQKPFNRRRTERALGLISGSIFQTQIDRTHPLFFGFTSDRLPVFRNHTNNLECSEDAYLNPGIYTSEPLLAGYASDDNVAKIADAASVRVIPMGRGRLIAISDNPNFRGFWKGTSRLLINAIFFSDLLR